MDAGSDHSSFAMPDRSGPAGPFSTAPTRPAHVLVAAYACNPFLGSEEAVGWDWARSIAAIAGKVTVITADFHRADIAAAQEAVREAATGAMARQSNLRFVHVPHRPFHYRPTPLWKRIENSLAKPVMNLAYAQWQRDAYRVARALAAEERFDLVHQLTYVGFRFPGHLWRLGLPFVWGPIGGLENTPWRLLPAMGRAGAIYYGGRNIVNSAQRRWLRSPRRAVAAAGPGLIAATGSIRGEIAALYGAASTVISEVVAPVEISAASPRQRQPDEPLRIVWSGLHLPGKALNLLIEALAPIRGNVAFELHILGDGPKRAEWQRLAEQRGLADRCVWHGMLPRDRALSVMQAGHLLAITSLKDLTSTVLLEGLALGLPVVCPDHCGFAEVVTPHCGIKVPTASLDGLVAGLRDAVTDLGRDEDWRQALAEGAIARGQAYGLAANRRRLAEVYAAVLAEAHAARPR